VILTQQNQLKFQKKTILSLSSPKTQICLPPEVGDILDESA
jgi:hypothetical protein